MILLALDYEAKVQAAFKEHRRQCPGKGCGCRGYTPAKQLKGLQEEIKNGRAMISETLTADTTLLNAGLL